MQAIGVGQQHGCGQERRHRSEPNIQTARGRAPCPDEQQAQTHQSKRDQSPGSRTARAQVLTRLLVDDRVGEQKLVEAPVDIQGVLPHGNHRNEQHQARAQPREYATQDATLGARGE